MKEGSNILKVLKWFRLLEWFFHTWLRNGSSYRSVASVSGDLGKKESQKQMQFNLNRVTSGTEVVAQWMEWSLLKPEICGLTPAIGKIFPNKLPIPVICC